MAMRWSLAALARVTVPVLSLVLFGPGFAFAAPDDARVRAKLDSVRVPFIANQGQADAQVAYYAPTFAGTLFVTGRPPHLPFKDGQVLNNILRSAFAKTGLKPPAPYVGSHILRHSLATNLVKLGAPLEEIGDMLRHRSRASTMIYAKLDVEGLRSIAQPWPVAGGAR